MQDLDKKEQRRFSRWHIDRFSQVRLEGAQECSDCRIKDISFKGVRIVLQYKVNVDTFLKLKIYLSRDCNIEVDAWVVWYRQVAGKNVYGIYFSKISDSDKEKIYKFILEYYPTFLFKRVYADNSSSMTGGEAMQDRRTFSRNTVSLPVKLLDPSSDNEVSAVTQDISAKGVGLVLGKELKVNSAVEMWLEMPDKGTPLYTRGDVVWSRRIAADKFTAGISLEKADLMGFSRAFRNV